MSVFIKDYCKSHTNDFAKRLKKLCKVDVFIGSDGIIFDDSREDIIAKISIGHTISCNDIIFMQDVLAGCYWRFVPSFDDHNFALWIDLDHSML